VLGVSNVIDLSHYVESPWLSHCASIQWILNLILSPD